MRIGVYKEGYPELRNILFRVPAVDYIGVASNVPIQLPFALNDHEQTFVTGISNAPVDLIHYFNAINFADTPYVTTGETIVPPFWQEAGFRHTAALLASPPCRRILFLSESAYRSHLNLMHRWSDAATTAAVVKKMTLLHPPQALLPNNLARFSLPDAMVRFIFIGNEFFRKGGLPMLRAFEGVQKKYPHLSLSLVTNFTPWAQSWPIPKQDINWLHRFLAKNKQWVHLYTDIPNQHLLAFMAQHHVGVLPSFVETYGYAVLEMQAAGLPVITTNIQAFPEINNDECGFIACFPEPHGILFSSPPEQRAKWYKALQARLTEIIVSIMQNPDILEKKSRASTARITAHHCPVAFGKRLGAIYKKALEA